MFVGREPGIGSFALEQNVVQLSAGVTFLRVSNTPVDFNPWLRMGCCASQVVWGHLWVAWLCKLVGPVAARREIVVQ
jgi:hypothetical protein